MNATKENPIHNAASAQKNIIFIEKMISGLNKINFGGRTVYEGEDNLRIEIRGDKVINRGMLKPGWMIQLNDGRARIVKVDPGRAVVIFGNGVNTTNANSIGISATSEVEILDPDAAQHHHDTEKVIVEKTTSPNTHNTKYRFDGEVYGKSPLARAIVAKYVKDNQKVTIKKLRDVFPDDIMGRLGVFKEIGEAQKISGDGQPRYFFKDELLVKTDKFTIAVCNQFTTEKIDVLIEASTKLGYKIERCTNC